jgi:hypothetical protein
MTSWSEFSRLAPELAAFGEARFRSGVAYLGTLRADGGPRVHPVTPILGEQLFLFMEPTSPKGKDLQRDDRYALHCSVADSNGGEGEFYVRGRAILTTDHLVHFSPSWQNWISTPDTAPGKADRPYDRRPPVKRLVGCFLLS